MPDIEFRGGRLKPHPDDADHRRLKLRHFLEPANLPAVPPVVDWLSLVQDWPMYGNDQYGDCVWAMIGHSIEAATCYGQGSTVQITEADVLAAYSAVTGFDPKDPSTDNGTVIQDALDYWRKTGIEGHKILAFAQVDHENLNEVMSAVHLFGHVQLGINFPKSAMEQFNTGQPWDTTTTKSPIEGGHAVDLGYVRNSQGNLEWELVSWAERVNMTNRFFTKYVEEAWVVITPEWFNLVGDNPEGINTSVLGGAFTELTGDPSPFPVSPPAPPGPQPPPPVVGADPADRAFLAAQDEWRAAKGL